MSEAKTTSEVESPSIVMTQPAYYQISTDSGYVKIQIPFRMSPEDAEHVIDNFDLIAKQLRRRSKLSKQTGVFCGECHQEMTIVRPGKHQCDNVECPSNILTT